jgi:hypothetical protein
MDSPAGKAGLIVAPVIGPRAVTVGDKAVIAKLVV